MRVLDAVQMREADARGVERAGEVALMRAAGRALADAIELLAPEAKRLVAFAGPGNNGGDAFAAFAELDHKLKRVVYAAASEHPSEARSDAQARAEASGVDVRPLPLEREEADKALARADLALDALLGTGSRAEPSAELSAAVDALSAGDAFVLAVDLPTGVDATSGSASAHTVRADATVTLGALKTGLLQLPAREYVGKLFVGEIGLAAEIEALPDLRYYTFDEVEFLNKLPVRAIASDKRASGAPLLIAGSRQFPGAAVLCARGAARAGAGYVTLGAPSEAAPVLRAHLVEQVVVEFSADDVGRAIDELSDLTNHCSAVGIGPGLGLGDATGEIVRGFIARCDLPIVADAGALFHLGKNLDLLRGKRCVLTPHEGEFARLSGKGTVAPGTRAERLREFVGRTGITTLLKGDATLVDDGERTYINPTGSNALATAGTGDVLTGIIATLLSQGLSPLDAAAAGAYWHGLAGQKAGNERRVGVVAGDLPDVLAASLPEPAPSLKRLVRVL
jgi:NAD(P)H-hydrate epimerase